MSNVNPVDGLRARIAVLDSDQRAVLRRAMEARGIPWERVAPQEPPVAQPADADARPTPAALSPAQLHFWIQQSLHPRSSAYLIAFQWRIEGKLNRPALERSLQHLVDRHEPLRTCFPAEDGLPRQQVLPRHAVTMAYIDLRPMPAQLMARVRAVATEPFDLGKSPPFRTHLFQLGESEHVLVFSMHHIIADGWSRGIIRRELAECYRAFCDGRIPGLRAVPRRFTELVAARQGWIDGPECARQKAYWQKRLADLEPLELPADGSRQGAADQSCATIQQMLPTELSGQVRSLASTLGTTTFVVLLAAFKLLLHRYSGNRDLAVCVPTADRREPDAADLIGLFTNTLVLRSTLRPDLTFRDWVRIVQQTLAEAIEHQDYPFAMLMETLGVNRDAGQNPLFQVVFQVQSEGYRLQNDEKVDLGRPEITVRQELLPLAEAKLDLSWYVMEREAGFGLFIEYRAALFDAWRMERMVGHFERLLGAIVSCPDEILTHLDYLSGTEKRALAASGVGRAEPVPDIGVHAAISAVAAQHAQAIALECAGRHWSYAELEAAAESLALRLVSMRDPVRPGDRVAVSLPGRAEGIIAFLAILKAGAIYVPLDPSHPAERLAYVLDDAEACLVLTHEPWRYPGLRCLDPITLPPDDVIGADLPCVRSSWNAYLLYTSGSTGRPKGALVTHGGLLNQLRSLASVPGIAAGDRMLAVTTPAFDISILEMLWPLSVGGTVVLHDQDLLLNPSELSDVLENGRITHMQATPATWRMLVDSGWRGSSGLTGLCGGEALDAQLAQRLIDRTGSFWNVYGPTETTIWASALRVSAQHVIRGKVPIGAPLDNMRFHVLDADMQPVPDGIPGELCIAGVGLGPGYWRRPSLTAEKFVPDPSDCDRPGGRVYRTGDLVVRRSEGEMEFIGRTDFQVKLRGYRIEIGEIESLLHEVAGVGQAIVMLDKEHDRLVAYVLLADRSGTVDKVAMDRRLRQSLAERLPRYMVPSVFTLMEAFPLNANGKVDRKRLPAPDMPAAQAASVSPRNGVEHLLLDIWSEVLGRGDIGVEDNFFDLGGDSVIGMQIVARALERGLKLAPIQIFEHQTIAAQSLVAQPQASLDDRRMSLWQRHRLGSGSDPWLVSLRWNRGAELAGQALLAVASHHPALRGRLRTVPLCHDAGAATDATLMTWAAEVGTGEAGMSWQACLFDRNGEQRLAIAVHRDLLDAPSISWLAADLRDASESLSAGAVPTLSAPGEYFEWLANAAPASRAAPVHPLADQGKAGPACGGEIDSGLDGSEAEALRRSARHLETTPEVMALAAMAQVLAQWSGGGSVEMDFLTCARGDATQRRALGNFHRLVPVHLPLQPEASHAESIAAAGSILAAFSGQGLDPDTSHLAQVGFAWTEMPDDGLDWMCAVGAEFGTGYELTVHACLSTNALRLRWRCSGTTIGAASMAKLAQAFPARLMAMRAQGDTSAAKIERLLHRLKQAKG